VWRCSSEISQGKRVLECSFKNQSKWARNMHSVLLITFPPEGCCDKADLLSSHECCWVSGTESTFLQHWGCHSIASCSPGNRLGLQTHPSQIYATLNVFLPSFFPLHLLISESLAKIKTLCNNHSFGVFQSSKCQNPTSPHGFAPLGFNNWC
jgi:hypothetical protein